MRDVDVTPALADGLRRRVATRTPSELEQFCGRYNIGYVRADADEPFEDIILQTFRKGRFLA